MVAVILLGLTFGLSQGVEFREKIPISKSFDYFPMEVGAWSGKAQTMEQRFVDTLDLSDYVLIDYKDRGGRIVNFYVAYYESQRKGESIHSPATCLPGGGWLFKEAVFVIYVVQTLLVTSAFLFRFYSEWFLLMAYVFFSVTILAAFFCAEKSGWKLHRYDLLDVVIKGKLRVLKEKRYLIRVSYKMVKIGLPVLLLFSCFLPATMPRNVGLLAPVLVSLLTVQRKAFYVRH
ncbi:MAG: EpsI family protein [Thermodesulfobacteriota bacterium]|nr:EpsI family protein [Thermodesulfobacteriota bacterium]